MPFSDDYPPKMHPALHIHADILSTLGGKSPFVIETGIFSSQKDKKQASAHSGMTPSPFFKELQMVVLPMCFMDIVGTGLRAVPHFATQNG